MKRLLIYLLQWIFSLGNKMRKGRMKRVQRDTVMGKSHDIIMPDGTYIRRAVHEQSGKLYVTIKGILYTVVLDHTHPHIKGSSIMISVYRVIGKLI